MRRWEVALLLGMVLAALLTSLGAFGAECDEVRREVLRLHVLANSDSESDQALKLAVRDAVLEGTRELFENQSSKEELLQAAQSHLGEIEALAAAKIQEAGYDYPVQAQVVEMYFETREYDGVALPAGQYDALRLVIGEGSGQNWWCVMFPPMCIPAATEPLPLEERIESLGQTPRFVPKLAVVELIEKLSRP